MDASSILSQRLMMQGLVNPSFKTPGEAVHILGAVQAQDYPSAKWALSLRLKKETTDEDFEGAMTDGSILRTHVMRPTWHFVSPMDIRWMQMLTGPLVKKRMGYYNRLLGLNEKVFAKTNNLIEKALKGNNYLMRKELDAVLKKEGIITNVQKRAHIVSNAELDGIICSGPLKGKQFTYALIEDRAPKAKELTREEALKELVLRYFSSHGPATVQDFVWWSGLPTVDARKGIELAKLKSETLDGHTYWYDSISKKMEDISETVFLLPNYDEYTISYKTSRNLYYPSRPPSPIFRENVVFNHAVVAGGVIVGMWSRTLSKKGIRVRVKLFSLLDQRQKRTLHEAVERYGEFFHLPAKLEIN